jgi:protein gp37
VFDNEVPPSWLADLIRLAADTPHLTWLWLTKRPQNAKKRVGQAGFERVPPNVAIGTTIEDPERARGNLPWLCNPGGAVDLRPAFLFVSCEPALGDIAGDLKLYLGPPVHRQTGVGWVSWVITGGETDQGSHKARPSNPQWFRDIRDQCAAAGVAYHHKQNGEWVSVSEVEGLGGEAIHTFDDHRSVRRVGKKRSGRLLDGALHDAMPEVAQCA